MTNQHRTEDRMNEDPPDGHEIRIAGRLHRVVIEHHLRRCRWRCVVQSYFVGWSDDYYTRWVRSEHRARRRRARWFARHTTERVGTR